MKLKKNIYDIANAFNYSFASIAETLKKKKHKIHDHLLN